MLNCFRVHSGGKSGSCWEDTQGNVIKDGLISYMPKGCICHLTIDTARVKMATGDKRKLPKQKDIQNYKLCYIRNCMTKFGRHLIYVQFNNMGYYRMLNTEINKNVYEILWFLTRLIRYITKHWDIFSRAFNFTQVKSFSEVEQIVWKILYAWVSAFLICLTLFIPCLTISEFRSEWKHIPLYEKIPQANLSW